MDSFKKFIEAKDTHKTKDGRTAKKGLWYNIHQKRKRGEAPAKPGDKDYPATLDIGEAKRKGAPKMKDDWLKQERERNRKHDAAMGRTPTGRKKPVRQMTSTQRSLAQLRGESLEEGILKPYHAAAKQPWSKTMKDSKGTAGEYKQIAKGKDFTVWYAYRGSNKSFPHYVVKDDKIIGSGMTVKSALKDAGLKEKDLTHRSKFTDGSPLNKGINEEVGTADYHRKKKEYHAKMSNQLQHQIDTHYDNGDDKKAEHAERKQQDHENAADAHHDAHNEIKKYGREADRSTINRAVKMSQKLKEQVELEEGNMMSAAKELEAYARKNGGIDKNDFMKAVMMMKKNQKRQLDKFVDELDTEPREKILSVMQKHMKESLDSRFEAFLDEKLKASDDMGTWVKDFYKSDAPQFKGKSKDERRKMAVAAKLSAERNEETEIDELSMSLKDLTKSGVSNISKAMKADKTKKELEALKKRLNDRERLNKEEHGAGDEGTDELVKKFKKDTPNA